MFTRTWLALLPLLSIGPSEQSKALATRALNVMHRGVLPHLTRAILVMDWIANCVDYGGTVGLLALNGLFTLIKEYNLFVLFISHLASVISHRSITVTTLRSTLVSMPSSTEMCSM